MTGTNQAIDIGDLRKAEAWGQSETGGQFSSVCKPLFYATETLFSLVMKKPVQEKRQARLRVSNVGLSLHVVAHGLSDLGEH